MLRRFASCFCALFLVLCSAQPAFGFQGAAATTTTLISTPPAASIVGQPVTFTITVTDPAAVPGSGLFPTGTVTLNEVDVVIGSAQLAATATDGVSQATFTTSRLSPGTHTLTAVYGGDVTYNMSTSADLTQDVNPRASTTALALDPTQRPIKVASTINVTVSDNLGVADPATGKFSAAGATLNAARTGATATLLPDGRALVAGGTDAGGTALDNAEYYRSSVPIFENCCAMTAARTGHTATRLQNGTVLVVGGSNAGAAALGSAEIFSLAGPGFTAEANALGTARSGHTATLLPNGDVLIAGGRGTDGNPLTSTEIYTPGAPGVFSQGPFNLGTARSGHTATLLANGLILFTGGDGTGSAELFNPVSGSTPLAIGLSAARSGHFAVPLLDGNVLIAGGSSGGVQLDTALVYDALRGTFVPITGAERTLIAARNNAAAAMLDDGTILVAGGTGTGGTAIDSAEQYTAAFDPQGIVGLTSDEATDQFGVTCILTLNGTGITTCATQVTPQQVGDGTHDISATFAATPAHATSADTKTLTVVKATPIITWNNPAAIEYGTALTATQLNATASYLGDPVPGTFTYTPPAGTVLNAGAGQTLSVEFTPDDAANFNDVPVTTVTIDLTVKSLTITGVTAGNKIYDGNTVATLNTAAAVLNGIVAGDDVNLDSAGATGTFDTPNAGNAKPVTVSGFTISGTDSGNYSLQQPQGLTADITAKDLTITGVTANNKIYDRTETAALNTAAAALNGVVTGEDVALNSAAATGAFADKNVATAKPVTATGFVIAGADVGNYNLLQPAGLTADITAKDLTITGVTASSKIYDGGTVATLNTAAAVLNGVVAGDDVTLNGAGATGAFADKNVGAAKPVTVTGFAIAGTDSGNYNLLQPTGLTADITPKDLTITGVTANNKTYDANATATLNTAAAALNGVVPGDDVTLDAAGTTGVFADSNAGNAKPVTVTGFAITGTDTGNYNLLQPAGTTADITPRPLTITADSRSKTYGDLVVFAGTEFTTNPGGVAPGEAITSVTLTSAGAAATAQVAGSPFAIVPSNPQGIVAGNYAITFVNGALTVNPAPLTVTANNRSKTYGDTVVFAGTEFSSAGLKNADTVDSVTLTSAGAAATALVAGSPYAIVPSNPLGTGLANYVISFVNGNLTVNAAALTITANSRSKTYGQTVVFTGTEFTSAGLLNGDTIATLTLTSDGATPTAQVAGSPYAIVATNPQGTGLENYSITFVNGSLTVDAAPLTITANSRSKTYGDIVVFAGTEFTSAGLLNADTITSVTLTSAGAVATAQVAGSPYAIIPSNPLGTGLGNYVIAFVNGSLTVNVAPLTVTANSRSKTYGDEVAFAGTEFTVAGLKNADTVNGVTLTSAGAAATAIVAGSPYVIVITDPQGTGLANYAITLVNGILTVNAAPLTITADSRVKNYGDAVAFAGTEFTTAGLRNADTVALVTLTSDGAAATAFVTGSPYAIVPSDPQGTGLDNYTIGFVNGSLTVNQVPLAVTADSRAKNYGDEVMFVGTEFTALGLKNADVITTVTLTSTGALATATVAAGPYAIVPSNAQSTALVNYAPITYVNGLLTVNPVPLTITANDRSREYGPGLALGSSEFTPAGLKNADAITGVTLASTLAPDRLTEVGVYPGEIVPSNAQSAALTNYSPITYLNGALTITKRRLTITARPQAKIYGDPKDLGTTAFDPSGLTNVDTDSITGVTLASPGTDVHAEIGGYAITPSAVQGTRLARNYADEYVNSVLTVDKRPLTITARNRSRIYGDGFVLGSTEFNLTNLANSDTDGVNSVNLQSAGTVLLANVGTYSITASAPLGTRLSNYDISFANGNLVINAAMTTTTVVIEVIPAASGPMYRLTAAIAPQFAGSPQGKVTFSDGATALSGPVDLVNGVATFTTAVNQLPAGSRTITGAYNRQDPNFAAATTPRGTGIAVGARIDTRPGQPIPSQTLAVTNPGSAALALNTLICEIRSQTGTKVPGTTCTVSPGTLNLAANASTSLTLDLRTTSAAATAGLSFPGSIYALAFSIPGFGILGLAFAGDGRRRRFRSAFITLLAVSLLLTVTACGGGGFKNPDNLLPSATGGQGSSTQPGTYVAIVEGKNSQNNTVQVGSIQVNVTF